MISIPGTVLPSFKDNVDKQLGIRYKIIFFKILQSWSNEATRIIGKLIFVKLSKSKSNFGASDSAACWHCAPYHILLLLFFFLNHSKNEGGKKTVIIIIIIIG